jgi:hypothetical protein
MDAATIAWNIYSPPGARRISSPTTGAYYGGVAFY